MGGARQAADSARAALGDALVRGRRRAGGGTPSPAAGPQALMSMQRAAGNSAVSALLLAQMKNPGDEARADIDAGLREVRRDEPAVDPLEKGLRAAKKLGVPVDLEGIRPPPSALAVTVTGFGPGQVAAKKPVPPKKPVPAKSKLGKAAAKRGKGGRAGGGGRAPGAPSQAGGPAVAAPAAELSGDQLLQPPVKPPGVRPDDDPAFAAVTKRVTSFAKAKRAHPPASAKAKEAQDAALAPADDLTGQAKAAKADDMAAQPAGTFDKKAFVAAVKAAIEAKSPKTLKEADDYKKSGKAKDVKGDVQGLVTQGKDGQTKDIATATEAAPDTSKAVPKPVTPMGGEDPGAAVAIPASGAVPKPAPAEQLNLEAGKHQATNEMAEGEVTEQQLAESGEPDFEQALADKKEAAAHADRAPGEYRQQEQQVIGQTRADADATTSEGVAGMQGAKGAALAKLVADKGKTKSKDEQQRAQVTAKVQSIFDATEADVNKILGAIDPKVEKEFDRGEKIARARFENFVAAKMSAYKKDRYGGWTGKYRWFRDKIRGMPSKVNEFYVAGRELYLKQMDVTISNVAEIVGRDLTAAKTRIATGKREIATYVQSLPKNLRKVGAEASKEIGDSFEQLESEVQSKQESVVDTLATKYVTARKGLDERIEELQAANRGLVDKVVGAIKAIVNTIRELAAMLKNVLSRVAGVVGQIIKAPVKFLGNLIAGIKGGINRFKDNFVGHLRTGLMSWLFGALAEGGVELPDSFDIKGVFKLLGSIFGLTWRSIRDRIVKRIGAKAMEAAESGVAVFQKLAGGGVGELWEMLLEKVGDIKEMILDKVKDFVLTKIVTAGITWLISLLNPAAAFIKACKLIYDVVMFFVNNASRIAAFVNTIIDSVADIVRGNVGGVAAKIENVLSQMLPLIIGFLASVIGLGGVGAKIREIVQKLRKPVTKALDAVIATGLKLAAPLIRGLKGVGRRVKAKVAAGKAWVKGKAAAGKEWVKGKAEAAARKVGILRRPVRLREGSRTLSADLGTGMVVLRASASDAAPDRDTRTAVSAEEQAIRHLTRTGSAARGPVANHLRRIGDMLVAAHRRVGGPGGTPGAVAPIGPLNANQQRVQQALANPVRRHGGNSGLVPRQGMPRALWLESEHVIPVSWVSIALRLLGQRAINRRGGFLDRADDDAMTTVLVYYGAARRKSREESAIYNVLKSIVDEEMPRRLVERSRAAAARDLKTRTSRGQREEMRSSWASRVNRLRSRLLVSLNGQLSASASRTERAVLADHAPSKHAVRGHVPSLPQTGHIRTAAARQIEDMARILSERVENMFPAESAMAEARQDDNVREDLRRAERERVDQPPSGYRRRPSGLYVPAGMPSDE